MTINIRRFATAQKVETEMVVKSDTSGLQKIYEWMQKVQSTTDNVKSKFKEVGDAIKDSEKESKNLVSILDKGFRSFSLVRLTYLFRSMRRVSSTMVSMVESAAGYEESLNLYRMALGKYAEQADQWASTISDALMLDPSDIMQYTGAFFNLTKGLGVIADDAYTMSTSLTQLTYDMSSYLNISVEAANQKLQSAMSGQARAIQGVGVAIQSATLQELAYSLGVKKSVGEMTQAEKTYLRYIQIMKSTTQMQGDLGRTMITPANAMRVLRTQLSLLGRAIGQVFTPIIMKSIPYLMAFTSVLTQMAKRLAELLGYKLADVDYSNIKAGAKAYDDYGDSVEEAGKKVHRSLAPFDELNVVESESATAGDDNTVLEQLRQYISDYDMLADYNGKLKEQAKGLEGTVKKFVKAFAIGFGLIKGIQFISGFASVTKKVVDVIKGFSGASKVATGTGGLFYKLNIQRFASDSNSVAKLKLPSYSSIKKILGELALITTAVIAYMAVVGLAVQSLDAEDEIQTGIETLKTAFKGVLSILPSLALLTAGIMVMAKLKVTPKKFNNALKQLAEIVVGTTLVVSAIGLVATIPSVKTIIANGVDALTTVFKGLGKIFPELAIFGGAIVAAGVLGKKDFAKYVFEGLKGLALILDGVPLIVLALGGILSLPGFKTALSTGIDSIVKVFKGLGSVAIELGVFAGAIDILGIAGAAGGAAYEIIFAGLLAIGEIIGGLELVVLAIGAFNKLPYVGDLMATGLDSIITLFSGLGQAIGGFMGGIVAGITEGFTTGIANSLGVLGSGLSDFMENAKGFFSNLKLIDKQTLDSVKSLSESILILTGASLLNGISRWFSIITGDTSLVSFGKDLAAFGVYFAVYANTINKIDNLDTVNASTAAAKSLAEFAKLVPNRDGLVSVFTGDNTISDFGYDLKKFGAAFKIYYNDVKDIKSDAITASSAAAQSIAEFARVVPNRGGLVALFTGDNTLSDFGIDLETFGPYFKKYANSISGIDASVVETSANAAKTLTQFADNIPNRGGLAALFAGDNTISKFGDDLQKFGTHFKSYYNTVSTITWSTIDTATASIKGLIDVAKTISDSKNGEGAKLKSFASDFKSAMGDYKAGLDKLKGSSAGTTASTSSLGYSFGQQIGKNIKAGIQSVTDNISFSLSTTSGKSYTAPGIIGPVKGNANGGYVSSGDLFMANENGRAEFMAHVGNQTAVYNQDQMVTALTNAIVSGFSSMSSNSNGGTTNIYIDGKKVYSGQTEYQNREADRYGTATIRI